MLGTHLGLFYTGNLSVSWTNSKQVPQEWLGVGHLTCEKRLSCFQCLSFSLYELNSAEPNTDWIKGYDPKDNHKIDQKAETIPNGNEWSE